MRRGKQDATKWKGKEPTEEENLKQKVEEEKEGEKKKKQRREGEEMKEQENSLHTYLSIL